MVAASFSLRKYNKYAFESCGYLVFKTYEIVSSLSQKFHPHNFVLITIKAIFSTKLGLIILF